MTQITLDCADLNFIAIIKWCNSRWGIQNWDYSCPFPGNVYTFYFPTESDAMMFLLRWA
jgi:hypothetical protein